MFAETKLFAADISTGLFSKIRPCSRSWIKSPKKLLQPYVNNFCIESLWKFFLLLDKLIVTSDPPVKRYRLYVAVKTLYGFF